MHRKSTPFIIKYLPDENRFPTIALPVILIIVRKSKTCTSANSSLCKPRTVHHQALSAVLVCYTLSCCDSLQWRHNERGGVSNHQCLHCVLNCWFRRGSKKTSKLRVTGLCAGNSPVTGEFPAQRPVTRKMSFGLILFHYQIGRLREKTYFSKQQFLYLSLSSLKSSYLNEKSSRRRHWCLFSYMFC